MRTISIDFDAPEADRRAAWAGRLMGANGLTVDHRVAWRIYKDLDRTVREKVAFIRSFHRGFKPTAAGKSRLIFDTMNLEIDPELPPGATMTDSGRPSVAHASLVGMVRKLKPGVDRDILRAIILMQKALTTRDSAKAYLSPKRLAKLADRGVSVPKPDDYHVYPAPELGPRYGVVHSKYNPKTLNGRFASSQPNIHALNSTMKAVFRRPGHVFIQADMDQLHIRIQANEWRIPRLQRTLTEGLDPHLSAMFATLGATTVTALPGWVGLKTKPAKGTPAAYCRQTGKVLNYTGAYGGGAGTLLVAALKEITPEGDPAMGSVSLAMFADLLRKRRKNEPAWERHYRSVREAHKRDGYLESPGTLRRFLCPTGKVTELYNVQVLGFEADLMNVLTVEAAQRWPQYLCNQAHDSIVLCVPEAIAEDLRGDLESHMNVLYQARPGKLEHPHPYTSAASVTPTLQEV